MSFLDRAIKRGIGNAVGNVVSNAVEKKATEIVAPVANNVVNKATENLTQATAAMNQSAGAGAQAVNAANANANAAALGGAFASFQNAAMGFANEAAKNMKVCPACGEPTDASKSFCPSCGAKLPEQTLGQGAVCSQCGRQNDVGTKFCAGCGAKLPAAIAEEQAEKAQDDAVLAEWASVLPQFPVWNQGGSGFSLENTGTDDSGNPYYFFHADGCTTVMLKQYCDVLKANGFRPAGKYPSESSLYKKVGGTCCYFDCNEPFCSDPGSLSIGFGFREPEGGFDYVKAEPSTSKLDELKSGFKEAKSGLKGLFKF